MDELLMRDPRAYLEHARRYLDAIARGHARLRQPPKQIFDTVSGGDFRVMPCVVEGSHGSTYSVKIVGTNRVQRRLPGQITVGEVCVLDPAECFVSHRFDACRFSSARTGLCAALAVERLAPAYRDFLVVGTGHVGYYAARLIAALGKAHRVWLSDRDHARATACADVLRAELPDLDVQPVRKPPDDLPVTVLATTSDEPFWAPPEKGAASLVVSLGADAVGQHELLPGWANAELYTDTADSLACGDLAAWRAAGRLDEPLPDLVDLFREPRPLPVRTRAFISTGSALLDNLTCAYLVPLVG